LSEKILFGELRPGQIVVVDVQGSGPEATFTLTGADKVPLPDAPPVAPAGTGDTDRV
jgi:ATP-dependent Clp protease ATP-binding subunit ClpC